MKIGPICDKNGFAGKHRPDTLLPLKSRDFLASRCLRPAFRGTEMRPAVANGGTISQLAASLARCRIETPASLAPPAGDVSDLVTGRLQPPN